MHSPRYTPIENFIRKLFLSHGIRTPDQLGVDNLIKKFQLDLEYHNTFSNYYEGTITIKKGSKQQEWQRFAHEICHHFRHCGDQTEMHKLFRQLQEYQAKHFAYHFCVPSFMLERIRLPPSYTDAVRLICTTFNVEPEFAARRLEMYKNKQLSKIINY